MSCLVERFWKSFWLPIALLGLCSGQTWGDQPRRLNVLFIVVDDLNTSLGCYGHPLVKTPNLDRLAARGMRFDRAYCQYPLCNPSRTSFLSGRRPETTKDFGNGQPVAEMLARLKSGEIVFLPEYFRRLGYFIAGVNKITHNYDDAVKWDVYKHSGAPKATGLSQLGGRIRQIEQEDAITEDGQAARLTAQVLEAPSDKPFFIALGLHKPHHPFIAPKRYFDMYPAEKIALPRGLPGKKEVGAGDTLLSHNKFRDWPTDDQQRYIAGYYSCVSFMDAQVGIVLDVMDRLKLWDNTIVVFFADHGYQLGEHRGLWSKPSRFEETARVPLIVAVPGKRAAVSSRLVELVDLYPTLTELCGLPAPERLEGASFVPLLNDPDRPWKKASFTFIENGRGIRVRTERYHYDQCTNANPKVQLFDLQADPHATTNLAGVPEHAQTLEAMRQMLKDGWRAALPK